MRFFAIGDEDTVLGLRFAGVPGCVVEGREDARRALKEALEDRRNGIIILTERTAALIREDVDRARLEVSLPLVTEIPDMAGHLEGKKTLLDLIREAIGVRV
jgi:V/A-type H+-transporting ATPase subunit F